MEEGHKGRVRKWAAAGGKRKEEEEVHGDGQGNRGATATFFIYKSQVKSK